MVDPATALRSAQDDKMPCQPILRLRYAPRRHYGGSLLWGLLV